jgi:hypothetical protein
MEVTESKLLPMCCLACGSDFSLLPGAKIMCPVCIVGKVIPRTIASTTDDAPTPAKDPAADLLDEAKKIVTGARRQSYGTPEDNFGCIACLWDDYLRRRGAVHGGKDFDLQPSDVAVMMVLMKCARLAETPDHHDSAVDIAGYAACLARCQKQAT